MAVTKTDMNAQIGRLDPVWSRIRSEAEAILSEEPVLSGFILEAVISHDSLEEAVAARVSARLGHADVSAHHIRQAFRQATAADRSIVESMHADIVATFDRDPACSRVIEPLLYFKGYQAIQTHRLAHWLWHQGRRDFALYLQSRSSAVFQTDISPTAKIGRGIFLDHATGLVVGATSVIEDDVSILQDVTLGGTGKQLGDRHPKIRHGVLIGAGAKVLGNIEVGHCSRVAAGSIVLDNVPHNSTVVGVPARVVGSAGCAEPSRSMDQILAGKVYAGKIFADKE
jgi:serine O-acetyltransferase